jgi:hypothetical protein
MKNSKTQRRFVYTLIVGFALAITGLLTFYLLVGRGVLSVKHWALIMLSVPLILVYVLIEPSLRRRVGTFFNVNIDWQVSTGRWHVVESQVFHSGFSLRWSDSLSSSSGC